MAGKMDVESDGEDDPIVDGSVAVLLIALATPRPHTHAALRAAMRAIMSRPRGVTDMIVRAPSFLVLLAAVGGYRSICSAHMKHRAHE